MRSNLVRMAALFLSLLIGSQLVYGAEGGPPERQGLFLGDVPAPVLGATVEVRVTGIIARAKVTQIFTNPSTEWVEGIYIFPLPEDAAVDALGMRVGNRTLLGIVKEKQEARQTYEIAKQSGKKASLIEQQRSDVFTASVAHIGPGETVEITIELQQVVRYAAGKFSLRFPMVVSPWTEGRKNTAGEALELPPVLERSAPPINPFAFHADLYPGFPLAKVESPSHDIVVARGKQFRYAVDLAKRTAPADSDVVLEWTPAAGVDRLWARRKIQALTDSLQQGAAKEDVRHAVIELGLRHNLVTDYTSLVVVDVTPTAPAGLEPVSCVLPVNAPRDSTVIIPLQARNSSSGGGTVEDVIENSTEDDATVTVSPGGIGKDKAEAQPPQKQS